MGKWLRNKKGDVAVATAFVVGTAVWLIWCGVAHLLGK